MDPNHLHVVPVQHCSPDCVHIRNGIKRILDEGKLDPIDMISHNERYFLLEYDPWDEPTTIVGYIRILWHTTEQGESEIHLYDFTIFPEYRRKQFGRHCVQIIQNSEVFRQGWYRRVCPRSMNAPSFLFVWKNCPAIFMDPLEGEFANFVEHKPTNTQIRSYIRSGKYTRLVELYMEEILLYMKDQEEWDLTYLMSLPEYKAILYHYEHNHCSTCSSYMAQMWRRNGTLVCESCRTHPIGAYTLVDCSKEDEALLSLFV